MKTIKAGDLTLLVVPELKGCKGCIGEHTRYEVFEGLEHRSICATIVGGYPTGNGTCSQCRSIYILPEALPAYVAVTLEN